MCGTGDEPVEGGGGYTCSFMVIKMRMCELLAPLVVIMYCFRIVCIRRWVGVVQFVCFMFIDIRYSVDTACEFIPVISIGPQTLHHDAQEFLANEQWYRDRGIPYR